MSLFEATQEPFLLAAPIRIGREVIQRDDIPASIGYAVVGAHVRLRTERIVRPVLINVLQTAFEAAIHAQVNDHDTGLQVSSHPIGGYGEFIHGFFVAGEICQAQLEYICRQGQLPDGITENVILPSPDCYQTNKSGVACPVNLLSKLVGPEKEMGIWRISDLSEM